MIVLKPDTRKSQVVNHKENYSRKCGPKNTKGPHNVDTQNTTWTNVRREFNLGPQRLKATKANLIPTTVPIIPDLH